MKNHIPKEYMEELNGIADGSDRPFKHIAAANMATVKIAQLTQCSVFAAWGPATSNNKLIHVKSFDYPFIIKDPETGKYIQENQISIVRQPENGFVSVFPSFAGFYGSGGINEKGIGIGILLSHSHDQSYHGIPDRIKIQMILDHADTTNEALDIISANTTMGFNFILSDGQNQKGYVIEQTKNKSYIGTWNNSVESTPPFWPIDHVVRRTNCFINPTLATTQRTFYNPKNLLLFFQKEYIYLPNWRAYRALSRGIEKLWGAIDLKNTLTMLQEIYSGQTDVFLSFINKIYPLKKIAKDKGFLQSLCVFSAYPESGDVFVSFATAEKKAFEKPAQSFNLFKLLDTMSQ